MHLERDVGDGRVGRRVGLEVTLNDAQKNSLRQFQSHAYEKTQ